MVFANPTYLYLLLLLVPLIGWYIYKLHKSQASLQVGIPILLQHERSSILLCQNHQ